MHTHNFKNLRSATKDAKCCALHELHFILEEVERDHMIEEHPSSDYRRLGVALDPSNSVLSGAQLVFL